MNYYAELINEYEGLKIEANDQCKITDDIFDADILTETECLFLQMIIFKDKNINMYDCYSHNY